MEKYMEYQGETDVVKHLLKCLVFTLLLSHFYFHAYIISRAFKYLMSNI